MKKKNLISFVFLFILSLAFISSVPPVTTVQNYPEGYIITQEQQEILKLNEDHCYNFFLSNNTNGVSITNETSNCTFFFFNDTGRLVFTYDAEYKINRWNVCILGSNFSYAGQYPYGVYCQNGGAGGTLAGTFLVTAGGKSPSVSQAVMYGIILFILLVLFLGSFFWFNSIEWGNYTTSEGVIVEVTRNRTKKTALFFLSYLLMILLLFVGRSMAMNFMFLDDTPVFFDVFFWILLVSIAPITIAVIAIIILTTIADTKLQEAIFRGLEIKK